MSGPKSQTTTVSNELPREFSGPISQALNYSLQDFRGQTGQPSYSPYGGSPLFGGLASQYGNLFPQPGGGVRPGGGPTPLMGSPGSYQGPTGLIGQSQGLIGSTVAGDYLNSNPYLDQTFNRAADLTRTRLASEFAGSGRNIGASLPARSNELQTLASNIYGQNYQAERDRQIGAIGQAYQFDPTNILINRIGGLIPGAGGTQTTTQPVHQDRFGQMLGLGLLGAGLFSDRRIKQNIKHIGMVKGHPWYEFEYIWGEKGQGVMSDEIPQKFVTKHVTGYDMVDYWGLLNA